MKFDVDLAALNGNLTSKESCLLELQFQRSRFSDHEDQERAARACIVTKISQKLIVIKNPKASTVYNRNRRKLKLRLLVICNLSCPIFS